MISYAFTGVGLNLTAGGDSVKVVSHSDTCAANPAPGTSIVTDLGPNDSTGKTNATGSFTFPQAGLYKVCYQVVGHNFDQVGTELLNVSGVPPTYFQDDGNVFASDGTEQETITLLGGSGMNLGSGNDKCKLVDWHDTCTDSAQPAGGSAEVGNDVMALSALHRIDPKCT